MYRFAVYGHRSNLSDACKGRGKRPRPSSVPPHMDRTFEDLLALFRDEADRRRFVNVAKAYDEAMGQATREAHYTEARAMIEQATANARYAIPPLSEYGGMVAAYFETGRE